MAKWKWLVAGLAVVLLVASPLLAAEDEDQPAKKARKAKAPKEPKAPKSLIRGQHAAMCEWCGCTDAQKADLEQVIRTNQEKMKAWSQANADPLKAANDKMAEARKVEDKEARSQAMKAAKEAARPLMEARSALQKEGEEAVLAVLTPQQRQAWAGYDLYRRVEGRLRKVELSDRQKDQVRDLAIAAAKDMGAAEDRKAQAACQKKFETEVMDSVLTAEQKAQLETARRAREPKGPKPEGEKKAKKAKGVAVADPDLEDPSGF